MADDLRTFQKLIEGTLRQVLETHYASYMKTYVRFRQKNGPQCPFCRSAAKFMYVSEVRRRGADFTQRMRTGDWDGYQ